MGAEFLEQRHMVIAAREIAALQRFGDGDDFAQLEVCRRVIASECRLDEATASGVLRVLHQQRP